MKINRIINVTIISGILLCAGAIAAENEVLDINGGFEEEASSRNGIVGKWRAFGDGKQPVPLTTTEVHGGAQALMLTMSDATEIHQHSGVEYHVDPTLLTAGDVLEFSAYVFQKETVPPGSRVSLSLSICGPNWEPKADVNLKVPNTVGDWLHVMDALTIPPEFDSAWHVKIVATTVWNDSPPASPVEIYVDDISLTIQRDKKAK